MSIVDLLRARMTGFRRHTDGAVTVDFVVLCAAVIGLALGTVAIFAGSGDVLSSIVEKSITE